MRFRKLRIAWSVFCGVAAVLLIVLWVRSYWWYDTIGGQGPASEYSFALSHGFLSVWGSPNLLSPQGLTKIAFVTRPAGAEPFVSSWRPYYLSVPTSGEQLLIPLWIFVLAFGTAAAVPWLPCWSKRFSLRTLLIATTLVAVVLGLIVWQVRQ
jgi:Na+/melibiose symporter-like transporter